MKQFLPLNHALCNKILRIWDSNYFVETCTVRGIELMRHDEYPRWPDILYITVHESSCNSGHFNVMSCYYVALYLMVCSASVCEEIQLLEHLRSTGPVMWCKLNCCQNSLHLCALWTLLPLFHVQQISVKNYPSLASRNPTPESMGLIETDWGWERLTAAHRLWAHSSQGRRHPEGA